MRFSQILIGFTCLCLTQSLNIMQSPMSSNKGGQVEESCHESMNATANMGDVFPMMVVSTDVGQFNCSTGACPGAPTCPSGTPFMIKCAINVNLGLFSTDTMYNFDQCVDSCAGRAGCLASVWWAAGQACYQSYENISSTPFSSPGVISAIKMSTARAPVAKCNTDDKQMIKSGSRTYQIRCGLDSNSPVIRTERGITYERCADLCDQTVGCAFVIAKDTGDCSLRSTWVNPDTTSTTASGQAWLAPVTGLSSTCCGGF